MEKKVLTRDQLLTKEKLTVTEVDLGNDEVVYVRQMTGQERDNFEQSLLVKRRDTKGNVLSTEVSTENFRTKLAVLTVCDAEGNLIFKQTDHYKLGECISAKKLEAIVNVAQEVNGITEKDKEELAKNSSADQVG